jgi:hypothetical protein
VLRGNELSAPVTDEAISLLPELFATSASAGVAMAVRASGAAEPAIIAASFVALVDDLMRVLND